MKSFGAVKFSKRCRLFILEKKMKKNSFLTKTSALFLLVAITLISCHRAEETASIEGFRLAGTYDYIGDTKIVLFEHERTGAKVLHIKNEDTQRAFALAFRTFAKDDKGVPHVFEHATLAGSEKYPSSNLFFQMGEQTYSTYMNAATGQFLTYYPTASLSEEQLLVNFDVYLNGLKNPIVMKDERAMNREAYRYVLQNPDGELSATGAVYNEMKGRGTMNEIAYYQNNKLMFPNSVASFRTGGEPEEILKIEWQELKDFHDKYYHPSNMLCVLYGKLDEAKFLKKLESEFLVGFEKKEISLKDELYEPWSGYREKTIDFPASATAPTEKQSVIKYNIGIDGTSPYDSEIIAVLMSYTFSKDSSWIRTTLREKLPDALFAFSYVNTDLYPYLTFSFSNVDEKDKEFLKNLCDEALKKMQTEGISKSIFEECELSQKFDLIFENEDSNPIPTMTSFLYTWSTSGNPISLLDYIKAIFEIGKFEDSTIVQDFIRDKVFNATQKSLLLVRPIPGLAEKKAAAEKQFFADKKNSMSKEEIDSLVKYTKDFDEWSEANEKIDMIEQVKAVLVMDLPEEADEVEAKESTVDSIRVLSADIGDADYFKTTLYFDAATIPQDQILDFVLYSKLLESVRTKSHSLEEIEKKLTTTIYSSFEGATSIEYKDGGYNPYFMVNFMTLNEKAEDAWKVIEEIIFDSDFSDHNLLRSIAGRVANSKKQGWLSNPSGIGYNVASVASGSEDKLYAYNYFLFGMMNYFYKVSKMSDEEMAALEKRLDSVKKLLLNKNGMILTCAGSEEGIKKNTELLKEFSKKLSDEKHEKQRYVFEPLPKNIAIAVTVSSSFNYSMISRKTAGYEVKGDMFPFASLVDDKFMVPNLRFKMGSYGAYSGINSTGVYEATYRDPNIQESFEFFRTIPELVKQAEFTQRDFDGYITSIYSSFAVPSAKRDLADETFSAILNHSYEKGRNLRLMKEMKGFNKNSILEYTKFYETLNEKCVNVTVANLQKINETRERYDLVITDLVK